MTLRRISKWMLTESGRTFTYILGGGLSCVVLLAHSVPHSIFLDKYRDVIRLYKNGLSVPLSKELKSRFQQTLDLLEVKTTELPLYQPFHVYGFQVMSAGTNKSKFGCIIGIPINFNYNNIEKDADEIPIMIEQKEFSWESENGQKLRESLILSEKAQIYAMAREIKMRQTWKPFLDTFYGTSLAILLYGVSKQLNEKFKLLSKPRSVRLVMYSLVTLLCITNYFLLKDLTTVYLEGIIDKQLVEKDLIFAEGGQEYYSKIIETNKILRNILGSKGESLYTALGNENHYIRTKTTPFVQRKAFFEEALSRNAEAVV